MHRATELLQDKRAGNVVIELTRSELGAARRAARAHHELVKIMTALLDHPRDIRLTGQARSLLDHLKGIS